MCILQEKKADATAAAVVVVLCCAAGGGTTINSHLQRSAIPTPAPCVIVAVFHLMTLFIATCHRFCLVSGPPILRAAQSQPAHTPSSLSLPPFLTHCLARLRCSHLPGLSLTGIAAASSNPTMATRLRPSSDTKNCRSTKGRRRHCKAPHVHFAAPAVAAASGSGAGPPYVVWELALEAQKYSETEQERTMRRCCVRVCYGDG